MTSGRSGIVAGGGSVRPHRPCLRICLDPGHGGRDPGAVVASIEEKAIVLEHARALRRVLLRRGHEVTMTRFTDCDLAPNGTVDEFLHSADLRERVAIANEWGADCFVSLHANASPSTAARGVWIIHDQESRSGKSLASEVLHAVHARAGLHGADEVFPDGSPWVGGRKLFVLNRTIMPAILIELGFLTNQADRAGLQTPWLRRDLATTIADGLDRWGRTRQLELQIDRSVTIYGINRSSNDTDSGPLSSTPLDGSG